MRLREIAKRLTPLDISWAMRKGGWTDDMRMNVAADKLYSPAGRITYDFVNVGAAMAVNCIYPTDYLVFSTQMTHKYKEGSDIELHVHWDQALNALPNFCVLHRFVNPGGVFGAWTGPLALTNNIFAFIANIHQMTNGVTKVGTGLTLSHMIEIKLYRDTTNVSGLFAGADPYGAAVLVKEFDCHEIEDAPGSWSEYLKWG